MKKAILGVVGIYIAYTLLMLIIGSLFLANYDKASKKPGRRHNETSIVLTAKY